jgi:Chemotaxis protein histidine kinase and related kinases
MRFLLEPAVRLMNRLKYFYKFALIGLLIVIPTAVLIFLLVAELNKNIDIAAQERLGLTYTRTLITLLDEARVYRNLQYSYSMGDQSLADALLQSQARVDEAFGQVAEANGLAGRGLDITWQLQVLRGEWETRKQDAFAYEPARAYVAFELYSRWLAQITGLIQQAGNASKLALDSDLDTAYLSDTVLRKLPLLIDALGQAEGLSANLPAAGRPSAADRERLLLVAGIVRSTLQQADQNAQTAFRRNEPVKAWLKPLSDGVNDAVPIFIDNIEHTVNDAQGRNIPRPLLASGGRRAVDSTVALCREELNTIGRLLDARIAAYTRDRNLVTGITLAVFLLVGYLFLAFDMSIRKGVYQLNALMDSVVGGDLGARGTVQSGDEIGSLTRAINTMLASLETMYGEVRASRDRLAAWNQELEHKVAARTASLRNLLDHAGQGFLSFGNDLRVAGEYSAECRAIFRRDILSLPVAALLCPDDIKRQEFLDALFQEVLSEQGAGLRAAYFGLLPDEFFIDGCYIGVTYKLISNKAAGGRPEIMLILTDRTSQKALADQMEKERSVLAMVVRVVTLRGDFFTAVRQYTAFCRDEMPALLQGDGPAADKLATVFRVVHTFKGTFGQLAMTGIVHELHEMEGFLSKIRAEGGDTPVRDPAAQLPARYPPDKMLGWLDNDLNTLKNILGTVFFAQEDMLVVDGAKLLAIEEQVKRLLAPAECRLLLPALRSLRYKPLRELLASYPDYLADLAGRYGKMLHPVTVDGDETSVDPVACGRFVKSLGHVFRNAVIHGLETPDERLAAGKDECGSVRCTIREQPGGLRLRIADDGGGIDPALIRKAAVDKCVCDRRAAAAMSDEEAVNLIFADGFSGAAEVDEFAGRGVGLGAVKCELELLGGTVSVNSSVGRGTEFSFFLPLPGI